VPRARIRLHFLDGRSPIVRTITRKLTEPAVVAAALYRELWGSARRLLPGRTPR
jgi:hypothetical protein